MKKDRVFFYCTVVPLVIMNAMLLLAHYQHQRDLEEVSESCKRQIESIWNNQQRRVKELKAEISN